MRPLPYRQWLAVALLSATAVLARPAAAAEVALSDEGFLLLDRSDPDSLFDDPAVLSTATAPSGPVQDFDDFLKGHDSFDYSQDRWDDMRKAYESGTLGKEPERPALEPVSVSTGAAAELPERPPEIESQQYGTSLSVTGRKVIGFNYSTKRFLKAQTTTTRPRSLTLFDIKQELQIRMQGKVGPKVTVNVDYDDTKTNKQDISVVYQGDPQEVVQNASFGDIDLSLPATEFVSYNKQLFGIRADLKYKRARATFIGSRTKGTTKTKRFVGNTQLATANIADINYLRRQYYDVTFGNTTRLPIQPASERVYLDQQNPALETPNTLSLVADDLNDPTAQYSGRFNLLLPGLDYTMDYANGVITFKNALPPQAVVAVDFTNANGTFLSQNSDPGSLDSGGTGLVKLIKTSNDIPISTAAATTTEVGWNRELKTYYFIGQAPLVRDDGRGNFLLRVQDFNRNEVGSTLNPIQRYPDSIQVDFENGIFKLARPFADPGNPNAADPDIYSPTPLSKRTFYVEYRYRLKTFFLEPNLVVQSETILIDGRRLARNIDYFVDYDSGFVTFFREDQIGSGSVIDATYEVAPFGGIGTESLLGTRLSYDLTEKWSVGSTLLYQSAGKPPGTPTLSDLPKSLAVYDADMSLRDLRVLPFMTGSFAAEVAHSVLNPNLSKYALVENMEGVKQEDSASLDANFWQIASNPTLTPADPRATTWTADKVKVLDVFPNAQASAQDQQLVLNWNYDFTVNDSSEVSIVHSFSDAGLDFSKKSFLEVVVEGDPGSEAQLNFHLGSINEDADGTGSRTLTCTDGTIRNSPKTEDVNCDAVLQQTEDGGFLYEPAGKATQRYVPGNGRIDTMDLNHNGRLDPQDFSGGDFGYVGGSGLYDATQQSTRTTINYSGWHTFQIPLPITSTNTVRWTAIRQVRMSLKASPGQTKNTGRIRIARLAVVGNLWQQGTVSGSSGTLTVNAVNNLDNPDYIPLFNGGGDAQRLYQNLYGDQQRQAGVVNFVEQALALQVDDLAAGATALTKRTFSRAQDMTQHEELRFMLYAGPPNTPAIPAGGTSVFLMRIGNDQNYWEVRVPLDTPGWKLYTLKLDTVGGSKTPTLLTNISPYQVLISSVGQPSFQQISQVVAGLHNAGAGPLDATVWFNEVHMAKPRVAGGDARKFQGDFDIPGWMSFGGKHRYVDRNFQTPTSVVVNQDNQQDSAYLNFKKLTWFPMGFTLARTITETPNTSVTGDNSNLVSLLNEGKVTKYNGAGTGTLTVGAWPRLTLGYAQDRTDYELLTRLDDRKTYSGQLQYAVPGGFRALPRNIDLSYSHSDAMVEFRSPAVRAVSGNYNTLEKTDDYGAKVNFEPWGGTTISPNYQFKKVTEKRSDFSSGSLVVKDYEKARAQTAGTTANFKLLSWLAPQVNYTITTNENANLTISTRVFGGTTYFFDIADVKAITRNATGGVTLALNGTEILPGFRPTKALTIQGGYQLQDGDSWQDVEKSFDSLPLLSVRQHIKPKSPAAQLLNSTLRDTYNANVRWAPFEAYSFGGRWSAFQSLSISNNYTTSLERKNVTGTKTRTVSQTLPDLLASMGSMEKILRTEDWMNNGQVNLRMTSRRTKTLGLSLSLEDSYGADFRFLAFKKLDTSLTYNNRASEQKDLRVNQTTSDSKHQDASGQATFDVGAWRFTPKIDWSEDKAGASGRKTQDVTVLTPSVLVRADLSLPRGLKLPFSKDVLILPNRIIWTTTTSLARRRSALTEADNSDLLTLTTSGDYEIAKNLRMTLNGGFSRLWHKHLKQEDYISYNIGTTLTFQF